MGAIQPMPLDVPPGVLKTTTALAAQGRWIDSDKVRFVSGKAEKRGGWAKYYSTALDGNARGGYGWTSSGKNDLLAFGTWRRLYSITDGTTAQDITPAQAAGTEANNPFTTVNGSALVTVHHVGHTLVVNQIVEFSGATAVGGLTLAGQYAVTSITDADNYKITASGTASSGASGGGAAVLYVYYLAPGQKDTLYGTGWGAGTWGTGTWGTARAVSTLAIDMRFWSIGNYGTELLVCPGDNTIFLWDQAATAARAVALSGAPATVRFAFVTGERFIFALGTGVGAQMTVKWPDVNDPTDWVSTPLNTANTRVLQEGNKLIAGCVFNDAINLIWSDTAVFIAQYLPNNDLIYDIAVLRTPAGLLGAAAFCVTPIGVFWLSGNAILLYNGSVLDAPNFLDVRDWFFGMFRRDKAHKAVMVYNALANEIELHYASIDGNGENDSYLAASLDTMSWVTGTMTGNLGWTAAAVRRNPTREIFAAHADTYVYQHESGVDNDGAAIEAYVESGPLALGNGLVDMDIAGYQPNIDQHVGDVTLRVKTFNRPRAEQSDAPLEDQSFTISPTTDLVDMKMAGRYAKHRLTSNVVGGFFRLGVGAIEVGPAGDSR